MFLQHSDEFEPGEMGGHVQYTDRIYIALNHLKKAGIPENNLGDFVSEGDMIKVFKRNRVFFYNIIQADRAGFINNSEAFTGYELQVNLNEKYMTERVVPL